MRFRINEELREQFRSVSGEMKKTESDLIRDFMKNLCSQYEQNKRHEALSKTFEAYWSCPGLVPVTCLIYAATLSKARGLLPPNVECLRRGL